MKQRSSLAPLGLVVIGGLLVVVALATLVALPSLSPDEVPTATPKEAVDIPAEKDIPRVSVGDAKAAFDLKQAVFVDVRDKISFDLKHIPGALAIPYDELEERLDELDPADWIITYCTWPDEESSAGAALILMEKGFSQVTPIEGGLQAWVDRGYPVEPWTLVAPDHLVKIATGECV